MSLTRPQGPDPKRPERVFLDGEFAFQVKVVPAMFPMRFMQDNEMVDADSALFLQLYRLVVTAVVRPLDRRYKVVVSRKARGRRKSWHVVRVDFCATFDEAVALEDQTLKSWDLEAMSDLPPLSADELHRARLEGGASSR